MAASSYYRTDETLIERLRARDESAVVELDEIYRARIQQLALRYMKSPEDAEEVAQDVILKAYRKIDAFRGDAALSSWIYRITFNTAMSRLRSQKLNNKFEVRAGDIPAGIDENGGRLRREQADWSSMADESVMRLQLRRKLARALLELPDIYRVPVVLRDVRGLSTEEASERLGIKEQTLKSRLHRGRLFLRTRLSEFANGLSLHRQLADGSMAV